MFDSDFGVEWAASEAGLGQILDVDVTAIKPFAEGRMDDCMSRVGKRFVEDVVEEGATEVFGRRTEEEKVFPILNLTSRAQRKFDCVAVGKVSVGQREDTGKESELKR